MAAQAVSQPPESAADAERLRRLTWLTFARLLLYLILGAIMDALAMVVITIPILLPTVKALGFDLVWFGVVVVVMIEMALISPPVGMGCFVLKGVNPSLGMASIYRGGLLFMLPICVLLALLLAIPDIALWLPRLMQ